MTCKGRLFQKVQAMLLVFFLGTLFFPLPLSAQQTPETEAETLTTDKAKVPQKIEVKPLTKDKEIQERIENILNATTWFKAVNVKVNDGVVFIQGKTKTEKRKKWAENLVQNTENVVAVVNQIDLQATTLGEFHQQIRNVTNEQWQRFISLLPFLGFSLIIFFMAWLVSKVASASMRKSMHYRGIHPLLADVLARGIAIFCFLVGLYIIMRVLGLSTIALTLIGGTGVLGIILGIAFRDITENLLASVLLSVQKPFENDDMVKIADTTGYVQKLTIRATILMTLDGQVFQIPNAMVYKNTILNYSTNPNRRESFTVGIGYDDAISTAQEVALEVLKEHPAILNDPEPLILVYELAPETVNLRIFFWFDGNKYNWQKMISSAIRLVKRAFQDNDISMPGREMELIFKDHLPVELLEKKEKARQKKREQAKKEESSSVATHAEGGLSSDAAEIQKQARQAEAIDQEANLLQPDVKKDKEQ